jgi:hypothetical protein
VIGGNVPCTITNTKLGTIIIEKTTTPSGDPQSFTINLTGPVNDTGAVTDATDHTFGNLPAGTYAVAEVVPAGWQLTNVVCTDGTPGAISIGVGDVVTCTFENTKLSTMVIQKTTTPAGAGPL